MPIEERGSPPPQPTDRANVLGCRIDRLNMAETVALCVAAVEAQSPIAHMSVNAAKLVAVWDDPEMRQIVEACDIVSADGQSIVWASKLLGDPLPERVAGIDLMHELLAEAARRDYSVYVLGAEREVLEQGVERLREQYTGLRFAGWQDGYFTTAEEPSVVEAIRAAQPDLLFIAMSSPGKERFLGRHGASLAVPFVMGVGGAIDVVSGITRRAPRSWQRLGLEWLFRLLQEPRRMLRRYMTTNVRFAWTLAREVGARRVPGRRRGRAGAGRLGDR